MDYMKSIYLKTNLNNPKLEQNHAKTSGSIWSRHK